MSRVGGCIEHRDLHTIYVGYLNIIQLEERFLAMMERYSAKAQALLDASSNLAIKIPHISKSPPR